MRRSYRNYNGFYEYMNYYNLPYNRMNQRYTRDYGPNPFVINIEEETKQNDTFRTVIWTGEHMQVTLMSINVGESIGLEIHPELDQFIRIEQGEGLIQMGDTKENLNFQRNIQEAERRLPPPARLEHLLLHRSLSAFSHRRLCGCRACQLRHFERPVDEVEAHHDTKQPVRRETRKLLWLAMQLQVLIAKEGDETYTSRMINL